MGIPEKRSLTLNAGHPLVRFLQGEAPEDDKNEVCRQIYDLCEMARQPLTADRMVAFLKRSAKILTRSVEK